jgi:hypothetical protein
VQELKQRQVAVFLSDYKKWFVGKVLEVYQRRTVTENFKIEFDDGEAYVRLDADSYGKSNNWVLLRETLEREGHESDSS